MLHLPLQRIATHTHFDWELIALEGSKMSDNSLTADMMQWDSTNLSANKCRWWAC